MLKKNSKAWQIAKKLSRRRYSNSIPIELLNNGDVKMQSLIRDNVWVLSLSELKLLNESKR